MTVKAQLYNIRQKAAGNFNDAHEVVLVKHWQETHGLVVDGFAGPTTISSIISSPPKIELPEAFQWKQWDGPLDMRPSSRREVYDMFGRPGGAEGRDKKWAKEWIIELKGKMPLIRSNLYFKIHKLIEPHAREGLRRAKISCPDMEPMHAASYVFRFVRHRDYGPLSYHSWGLAIDFDPNNNGAMVFKKGDSPEPWSPRWMEIWPKGLPREFVQAMKSVGFAWGGDWETFTDPMHYEFRGGPDWLT